MLFLSTKVRMSVCYFYPQGFEHQCVISIHEGSNVSVLFLFSRVRTSVCSFYPRGFECQCVISIHEVSNFSVLFLSTRIRAFHAQDQTACNFSGEKSNSVYKVYLTW